MEAIGPVAGIFNIMRRRRNSDADKLGALAQLIGIIILVSFISPQVRQTVQAAGILIAFLLIMVVAALVCFGIYRWSNRSRKALDHDIAIPRWPSESNPTALNCRLIEPPIQTRSASPVATVDLSDRLRSIDWFQFEKLVELLYQRLGYAVTRRGGANPDGGIDLLIEKDGQRWAVQCKHWKKWSVGVKVVREFLGAITCAGMPQGILITLSDSTDPAKEEANKVGIKIVSEAELVAMLKSVDAQFDSDMLAILYDTRKFCPKCEQEMVARTAGKGRDAGSQFWGCSTFPRCRFTMPMD